MTGSRRATGRRLRVQIVLPRDFGHAIGGYAVAYEYANRLAARGHAVEVLHLEPDLLRRLRAFPRSELRKEQRLRRRGPGWYGLSSDVRIRSTRALGRSSRRADAVVATAWQTAEALAACGVSSPRGFYLLQHDEVWSGPADAVHATWRLPLTRIVISGWLAELARELGAEPVHRIPNGIDTTVFRPRVPPAQRAPASVAMMWHTAAWKASGTGLEALKIVHGARPDLEVQLFSVYPQPEGLPEWVTWHAGVQGPSLCDVYNQASVFVSPSLSEGWPLPPAEAMASGCCLVSTDIPGVQDYAHDGQTALLVPAGDAEELARGVLRAVQDDALRLSVAEAGRRLIDEEFAWERAGERFEALLLEVTQGAGPER
jgi:glycosyltransferase involved in cell wall biosynthesis